MISKFLPGEVIWHWDGEQRRLAQVVRVERKPGMITVPWTYTIIYIGRVNGEFFPYGSFRQSLCLSSIEAAQEHIQIALERASGI